MNEIISNWERETSALALYFVQRYFGKKVEYYWIADDIGGVLEVCDRFFSLSDMVSFIKYKYTWKQLDAYYDYALNLREKNVYPVCIRDFKQLRHLQNLSK